MECKLTKINNMATTMQKPFPIFEPDPRLEFKKSITDRIASMWERFSAAEKAVLQCIIVGQIATQRQIARSARWIGCHPIHEANIITGNYESTTRAVRQIVMDLRRKHLIPIMGTSKGYRFPISRREFSEYWRRLEGEARARAASSIETVRMMARCLNEENEAACFDDGEQLTFIKAYSGEILDAAELAEATKYVEKGDKMSDPIIVRVFDIVGGPLGVSADDGQRVHDKIAPLLREGQAVVLSFEQVETLIPAFLNAAIGQLYGEIPEERIRELLAVRDLDADDMEVLKRVVENAKRYFANRPAIDNAWKEEVGNDEE